MDDNKLVEKTKEVFHKQQELTGLIDDLKDEVKKVYYENKDLLEENKFLKDELAQLKSSPKSNFAETKEEPVPGAEVASKEETPLQEKPVVDTTFTQQEESVEVVNYFDDKVDREIRKNAIAEFFLGKNVIAKIAAILIFLGVLTFGQMAYVDWLNDVGRALLILFSGLVFGAVAWYTEKKRHIVFSNVFYGVALFIIFYSILLAGFTFDLFGAVWISILLLALLLATMVYFKDKRYDFLDSIIFPFYLVIGYAFLYCLGDLDGVVSSIFSIAFVGLIGFNTYLFVSKHYKHNEVMSAIFQLIHFGSILYFLFYLLFNDHLLGSNPYVVGVYALLQVGILYIININFEFDDDSRFHYFSPILILIVSFPVASILNMALLQEGFISFSLTFFSYTVLLIPLTVLMYKKFKKIYPNISRMYYYTLGISFLIFGLTAAHPFELSLYTFGTRFVILGIGVIGSYIVLTLLQDQTLKYLFWKFVFSLSLFAVIEFFYNGQLVRNYISDSIYLLVVALLLLVVNLGLKYWKNLEYIVEKEILKLFTVLAFVPFILIVMKEYISDDSAYLMAVIMLWLVGSRWLGELKFLKTSHHTYYTLILNVIILLLTFSLNLIYFDHDFTQFKDVFKLVFMFMVNVYIVYSLKEIYVDHLQKRHAEGYFIFVYAIGVLIHSYYIHMYINIEFDKVILSSYFLIASAVGVLIGFRKNWSLSRRLGLFAIYYSLAKFFIYDFYTQDFSSFVRMMTYFILGFVLLGISVLYAYLERTYQKA